MTASSRTQQDSQGMPSLWEETSLNSHYLLYQSGNWVSVLPLQAKSSRWSGQTSKLLTLDHVSTIIHHIINEGAFTQLLGIEEGLTYWLVSSWMRHLHFTYICIINLSLWVGGVQIICSIKCVLVGVSTFERSKADYSIDDQWNLLVIHLNYQHNWSWTNWCSTMIQFVLHKTITETI